MTAAPLNNSAGKSIATQQAAQVLIAEYKAAYEASIGAPCTVYITYACGWFTFRYRLSEKKWRRADLERMRNTLLERAAS
jgi:hypothetical protein